MNIILNNDSEKILYNNLVQKAKNTLTTYSLDNNIMAILSFR